jgi:hypothetical protein
MKIQRRILSILSTMFVAGTLLALPLQAQQSNPQTTAQQQTQDTTQPQAQPAQTNTVPVNTQSAPADNQSAAPATNQAVPAQQQPVNPQPANPQSATPQSATPGSSVNPSQGPLQPVRPVTTYPDAAGEQQQAVPAQGNNLPNGPQPKKQPTEPVGAATAESVPTTGGAAAKPAGVAIAPAKQHQTRSLLLKVGAAVAAGAALGTVFALSHGTSSTPPGSGLAGVTQK